MPALACTFSSTHLAVGCKSCSSTHHQSSSPCKLLLFYPAPSFTRSLQLRQSAASPHVGMCLHASITNKEGLLSFSNLNKEASEQTLNIAHGHGTDEEKEEEAAAAEEEEEEEEEEETPFLAESYRNKDTWMPPHSMTEEEEEGPLFSADEESLYAQQFQFARASKDRNKASDLSLMEREDNESVGYDTEDEETTSLHDTHADKESSPVLRNIMEEEALANDETQNSYVPDCPSDAQLSSRESRAKRKARVGGLLSQGKDPIELLDSMPEWTTAEFWAIVHHLAAEKRFGEALQAFAWWRRQEKYSPREQHFVTFIRMLGMAKRPDISQQLFNEMKVLDVQPGLISYTALLQSYVESGCFDRAEELLRQMLENSIRPNAATFNGLILEYGKQGHLDAMNKLFNNTKRWGCPPDYCTYRFMVVAYAKAGLFRRMECMWREMDNNGWKLDFPTINAIIQGYAAHSLVDQMHASYLYVKDYRVLVSRVTIRAMASLYIRTSKFYQLRLFVKDVGLQRKDVGNLLWNLLLLAFAANFQIKNVQRSCLGMEAAGFMYDITTFNICILGYARMQMLWELHATLLRMRKVGVDPDMVTFGAVVDAYIFGRVRFEKMFEELDQLKMKELCPDVKTDPLVFEAFGKGDFQSSSETLMLANPKPYGKSWTYGLLLSFYLRKRGARRTLQNPSQTQRSRFVAKKFMF